MWACPVKLAEKDINMRQSMARLMTGKRYVGYILPYDLMTSKRTGNSKRKEIQFCISHHLSVYPFAKLCVRLSRTNIRFCHKTCKPFVLILVTINLINKEKAIKL